MSQTTSSDSNVCRHLLSIYWDPFDINEDQLIAENRMTWVISGNNVNSGLVKSTNVMRVP